MKFREMSKAFAPVDRADAEERETRERLLRMAHQGDVRALALLREQYSLRLPLVEARLGIEVSFPQGGGGDRAVPSPPRNAPVTTFRPAGSVAPTAYRPSADGGSPSRPAGRARAARGAPRGRRLRRARSRARARRRSRF